MRPWEFMAFCVTPWFDLTASMHLGSCCANVLQTFCHVEGSGYSGFNQGFRLRGQGRAEVHALPETALSVGHAQALAHVRQAMFGVVRSGFQQGFV